MTDHNNTMLDKSHLVDVVYSGIFFYIVDHHSFLKSRVERFWNKTCSFILSWRFFLKLFDACKQQPEIYLYHWFFKNNNEYHTTNTINSICVLVLFLASWHKNSTSRKWYFYSSFRYQTKETGFCLCFRSHSNGQRMWVINRYQK